MKKSVKLCFALLTLPALTSLAYAAQPGAYLGLGLGATRINTSKLFHVSSVPAILSAQQSNQNGGLGGRLFGGYNINEYFGLEAGYTAFAHSTYKFRVRNRLNGNAASTSFNYTRNVFDVVAKGYLPLSNSGFDVYGLAGAALVYDGAKANINFNGKRIAHGSGSTHKVRPVAGLGVSYAIPQSSVVTNLEYSHIFKGSSLPSSDALMLGVAYNFG